MATTTLGFIMSASQNLKRPAEAELEAETEEPALKIARTTQPNSFKNVFKQLSLMRPGLFFEMETDPEATINDDGTPSSYHMVVDVDGVKFKGIGPSKRNAKVQAAEKVLAHLESLGVKPREIKEEDKPIKIETKVKVEPVTRLTEEQKAQQMSGKNPVMMLHEIRPTFETEIESDERSAMHRKVVISVTIDGVKYNGSGRSNKNARARAAVAALKSLYGLEFTEFGENEIPVYLGEEWNWRQYTKKAWKSGGVQAQVKLESSDKRIKNAVMQLNDMYKGLEFSVIERTGPDHCPFFRVSVDIEGQKYEGEGSTKKAAKLDAAEHALSGLGQSGVLANRPAAKKQIREQNWKKNQWENKSNFVHKNENGNMGGYGHGGGNFWGDREQNGQPGMRGRGRGVRGTSRGRGGQGGQMRGGPMRGGPMRGRGAPRGRGTWSNTGDSTKSGTNLLGGMGRDRSGIPPMLPPPSPPLKLTARGRGTRGKAGRGGSMSSGAWGMGSTSAGTGTDYSSYQNPYTATGTSWSSMSQGFDSKPFSQSYGFDTKPFGPSHGFDTKLYGQSYGYDSKSYGDSSFAESSFNTNFGTSYDKNYSGGSGTYLNDNSYKNYQEDTSVSATGSWEDYYSF